MFVLVSTFFYNFQSQWKWNWLRNDFLIKIYLLDIWRIIFNLSHKYTRHIICIGAMQVANYVLICRYEWIKNSFVHHNSSERRSFIGKGSRYTFTANYYHCHILLRWFLGKLFDLHNAWTWRDNNWKWIRRANKMQPFFIGNWIKSKNAPNSIESSWNFSLPCRIFLTSET